MHPTASTRFQPGDRLLPLSDLRRMVPLSRSSIYAKVAAGDFPAPLRLSANRVAWREADVLAWLNGRAGLSAGEAAA